jgi:hypothetical protein
VPALIVILSFAANLSLSLLNALTMGFTDFSDLFGSLHEDAMNNVVIQLQRQRPSLFNYGTSAFVNNPDLLCEPIRQFVDEDVSAFGNPLVHQLELLRVPGYSGNYGLEYCFQLSRLSIDFFPENHHQLPPELKPMKEQTFSLRARVCAGLGCPEANVFDKISPREPAFYPEINVDGVVEQVNKRGRDDNRSERDPKRDPLLPPDHPIPFRKPLCFCLDLYAVLHFQREGSPGNPILALKLNNLEIVDVAPKGMEDLVECYLKTTLALGVHPKVKLAMKALVLKIEEVLTVEPTPVPAGVPNNPAVEDDQLKVFISLTV